ncbi:hypothetical protein [Aridibaculum aurantiacum]|uniref:hypothetical protein n=1 Tax=Aridibaculum aurantiacum TaxID=2810307 RepID=UPI001A972C97|nr:hypothetical protein [Aridibaculum aurantiacum]
MKNTFYSIIVLLVIQTTASAQQTTPLETSNKQFYTEVGGPGVLFSANLDGRFAAGERTGWGYRAGLGFTLVDDETITTSPSGFQNYNYRTRSVATLPLGINYLFGKPGSPNMFEVGAGITVLSRRSSILNYNDYNEGFLLGHFSFMYRKQPVDGGFSWRVGMTPIINPDGDIFPFAAVGLGFTFK